MKIAALERDQMVARGITGELTRLIDHATRGAKRGDSAAVVRALRRMDFLVRSSDGQTRAPASNRCVIVRRPEPIENEDGDRDWDWDWESDDTFARIPDEVIEASIRRSTADALIRCPRAVPLPRQQAIVTATIRDAERSGLQLPPFAIAWREGRRGIAIGAVELASGQFTMYLSVNVDPDQLRSTTFHETRHLHDLDSGIAFNRVELERRAIGFAARMAEGRPGLL